MAVAVTKTRVRDWKKLDEAHKRRGELVTVFFSEDGPAFQPADKTGKRGRTRLYSEATIEALTTLSRRQDTLEVELGWVRDPSKKHVLVS